MHKRRALALVVYLLRAHVPEDVAELHAAELVVMPKHKIVFLAVERLSGYLENFALGQPDTELVAIDTGGKNVLILCNGSEAFGVAIRKEVLEPSAKTLDVIITDNDVRRVAHVENGGNAHGVHLLSNLYAAIVGAAQVLTKKLMPCQTGEVGMNGPDNILVHASKDSSPVVVDEIEEPLRVLDIDSVVEDSVIFKFDCGHACPPFEKFRPGELSPADNQHLSL